MTEEPPLIIYSVFRGTHSIRRRIGILKRKFSTLIYHHTTLGIRTLKITRNIQHMCFCAVLGMSSQNVMLLLFGWRMSFICYLQTIRLFPSYQSHGQGCRTYVRSYHKHKEVSKLAFQIWGHILLWCHCLFRPTIWSSSFKLHLNVGLPPPRSLACLKQLEEEE